MMQIRKNLLLTGAFKYTPNQLNLISKLGFNIIWQQQESESLEISPEDIEAVVCNGLFLYHDISQFKRLKFIQLTSAGLDRIPIDKINSLNIALYNARGVYSIPMAEWAIAKVLDVYKRAEFFFENQKRCVWDKSRCLREIYQKNVAVLGCGSIGTEVAKRFKALDANVVGYDLYPRPNGNFDSINHISSIRDHIPNFDIIIICLPLTDETKGMINSQFLHRLKSDAMVVNIARGAIINQKELINFLMRRKDVTFALDVFEFEPLRCDNPLWKMKNIIISPHNSFISDGNSERLFEVIYYNLKNFIEI